MNGAGLTEGPPELHLQLAERIAVCGENYGEIITGVGKIMEDAVKSIHLVRLSAKAESCSPGQIKI